MNQPIGKRKKYNDDNHSREKIQRPDRSAYDVAAKIDSSRAMGVSAEIKTASPVHVFSKSYLNDERNIMKPRNQRETKSGSATNLLERYNCGPVQFSGERNALYERHLTFDQIVPMAKATPRDEF